MASKNQDTLKKYFYQPYEAAQLSGIEQETFAPLTSERDATGLQLGSGLNAPMLDVATPCTFTPVVLVVMSTPAMYTVDGRPTRMATLIKDLIESHAKQVTGIDFSYTLGTQQSPVGHDSQEMMVPAKTTRSQVSPSFVFAELSGNLVFNTFKKWIWDIQHPDTNASMAQVRYPGAYTMSAYSMSMMAIQFDPTMRPDHIIDAAYYTNMFPLGTGEIGFERTIGQVKHPERTINFSGIVQHNDMIKALAMSVAEQLALHKHNYNIAPPGRNIISKDIADLGLWTEHRERTAWATQDGVNVLDTTQNSGANDIAHNIDPTAVPVGDAPVSGSNFDRTAENWDQE